jgi:hypothetical protein
VIAQPASQPEQGTGRAGWLLGANHGHLAGKEERCATRAMLTRPPPPFCSLAGTDRCIGRRAPEVLVFVAAGFDEQAGCTVHEHSLILD